MNPDFASSVRTPRDNARGVESLLWLAAGAAWAIVALKAWSQSQKTKARHRTLRRVGTTSNIHLVQEDR